MKTIYIGGALGMGVAILLASINPITNEFLAMVVSLLIGMVSVMVMTYVVNKFTNEL